MIWVHSGVLAQSEGVFFLPSARQATRKTLDTLAIKFQQSDDSLKF
jgi:hypothetical protein